MERNHKESCSTRRLVTAGRHDYKGVGGESSNQNLVAEVFRKGYLTLAVAFSSERQSVHRKPREREPGHINTQPPSPPSLQQSPASPLH